MRTLVRLLLSALALASCGALRAQDTEAPMLTSITITPGSVNVTTGDQDVTVALVITDNDSGFDFGNLFLYRPDGKFVKTIFWSSSQRMAGDALNGTYVVTVTVPQYATPGTYRLDISLWDANNNRGEYGPNDIPLSNPSDAEVSVANTGTVDSAAPQLAAISVSPPMIDTGTLAQDVTVSFTITDDFAGFRSATVAAIDPSGNIQFNSSKFVAASAATGGDPLNGTYEATLTIPAQAADGTWNTYVSVRDEVGNTMTFNSPAGGSFTVMNTGGGLQGDLSDACDATQYSWSTIGDADWFIQADMTCDGVDAARSGAIGPLEASEMSVDVTGPGTLDFSWKVSSQETFDTLTVELDGSYENEISGEVDWTTGSIAIPPGPHTVTWRYEKDGGIDSGSDAGWVDKVKFVGDSDTQLPVLQRISISPSLVDISGGDVDVIITLEITDDFNGVDGGFVGVYDPAGEEYDGDSFSSFERISGDSRCGVYEIQITLNQVDLIPPDFFQLGTWRADVSIDEAVTFDGVSYDPFGGEEFPIPGAQFFTVADGAGGTDTSGPTLVSINSITPDPVDVTSGGRNVIVDVDISDNSSGFDFGVIGLSNSNGDFVTSVFFDTGDEVSSTGPLSATYQVSVPIPHYGPPGQWTLTFSLTDLAGNERDYPFDTAFPNPGDEMFTVTNTGPADTTNPVLHAVTISPGTTDTSASPRTISVSLDATDDLSGLRWLFVTVYDPTDTAVPGLFKAINGGAATSGPFNTSIEIPQGSTAGTWELSIFLRDMAGNRVRYGLGGGGLSFPTPGENEFVVAPAGASTTYDNFTTAFSLSGPDALPHANPDKDPFTNAEELLLGLDPTVSNPADPSKFGISRTATELQLLFTVDPALSVGVNGTFLEISDATGSPFLVTGQTSATLAAPWANQLPSNPTGTTYSVSLPFASGPNGHMRLDFVFP